MRGSVILEMTTRWEGDCGKRGCAGEAAGHSRPGNSRNQKAREMNGYPCGR